MSKLRKTQKNKTIHHSIHIPVLLGVGAGLAASTGLVAQTNQPVQMEKVVVTGSYIPTAETVGVAPVVVVGADDIQKSGQQDVLQVLKKMSTSFAGNGNVGQTIDNGGTGEANIALRNLTTLVLINGRRVANSAFSNGQAVDLNTIPVNMIERIEVLQDGASTIYGSDAIGGVVNIITKKNFNGVEISGRYGFPTQKTSNDMKEYRAGIVAGASDDKSSFTVGANYFKSDPLLAKDRFQSSAGIAQLAALNITPPSYVSPTYPGRVANDILAGSPFAVGAAGYNPAITTIPAAFRQANPAVPVAHTLAELEAAGVYLKLANTPQGAAAGGAFPLILTPAFGVISIQSQDRKQFFATAERELIGKELRVFADLMYANTRSVAALAPPPVPALSSYGLNIPASNPYNPFGVTLGTGGAGSPRIRNRLVDSGNRVFDSNKDFYRMIGGVKGDFGSGWGYEGAFTYSKSTDDQFIRNSVSGSALQQALTPDLAADPTGYTSKLTDSNGNSVPTLDYFALPGQVNAATLAALKATLIQHGVTDLYGFDARVNGQLFNLPAGPISVAFGGDWRKESLEVLNDDLYNRNLAIGLNATPTLPKRSIEQGAGFMEVVVPITSAEKNFTGAHSLELSASGRISLFNPGDSLSAVPKFGIRWQPIDEQLTARATYSQGFVTPTMFHLFGPPGTDNPTISTTVDSGQVNVVRNSNPNLQPSESEVWTGGVVFSPKFAKGLTLSVDYYNIYQDKLDVADNAQNAANSLNALGSGSPYAAGFNFASGAKLTTAAPNQVTVGNWGLLNLTRVPGNAQRTDGIDIGASYQFDTGVGQFTAGANVNILLNYEFKQFGDPRWYQYAGQYTDANQGPIGANGTLPDYTIKPYLIWEYSGFTVVASATYIPSVLSLGNLHPAIGDVTQGYTLDGKAWTVPDYYTIDLQVSYEFGKGATDKKWWHQTKVTVGVNNITDERAPLIAGAFEDNTDKSTYDILGRFVYFELSKKF